MYRHGSLTELIVWDQLRAFNVREYNWRLLSRPEPSAGLVFSIGLFEILPKVMGVAQCDEHSRKNVSRAQAHAELYASSRVQAERATFADDVLVERSSKRPKLPNAVKNDRRVGINEKTLNDIWRIASATKDRNLLFLWILSLMTEVYYLDSIVEAVIRNHPEVIMESLHLLLGASEQDEEKAWVYYMPGLGCTRRIEVNWFQKLVNACIVEWDLQQKQRQSICNPRLPLYIVSGAGGSIRNLICLKQLGQLGQCQISETPHIIAGTVTHPPLELVKRDGWRVVHRETDEECTARRLKQYGKRMFYPLELRKGSPMISTKRVYHKYRQPGKAVTLPAPCKVLKVEADLKTEGHNQREECKQDEQRLLAANEASSANPAVQE